MPTRALSKTKRARIDRKIQHQLYQRAVQLYREEQDKPPPHKPLGFRKVCEAIAQQHMEETQSKHPPLLNHGTLANLVHGGVSLAEFNAEKSWLTDADAEELISALLELASWGQPCSYERLRCLANEIIYARLGDAFPKSGVGEQWPYRFLEKHSDRLHLYKSRALDDVRAQAVNASANDAWFDLVEEVQLRGDDGNPIAPECTWGMDETGFQPNGSEGYEYVIGGTGQKLQYQQRKGSRETFTVLVTIGANGMALQPLVIYVGKGFQKKWLKDKKLNPSGARLAHSPKGWTDKMITEEYAIDFDKQTRDIAAGRTRALYLDGHNSHLSFKFIRYCRAERIKVPCYMPHATHVYQGLDVVCFSPVKKRYGKKRDALLRDFGEHITKENFLMVYGEVHLEILTPELIKEAFRKTGIVPCDRSVITKDKLAPSKESSHQAITPVIPPTPVRVVSEYLLDVVNLPPLPEDKTPPETPSHPKKNTRVTYRTNIAVNELKDTSAGYLFTTSPIKSSSLPPDLPTLAISPIKIGTKARMDSFSVLLSKRTKTPLEAELQVALKEERAKVNYWKTRSIHLQSGLVLQRVYCGKLRQQLNTKETKGEKRGGGKLKGDNLGRVITEDKFFAHVEQQEKEEAAERSRKAAKGKAEELLAAAMKVWEKEEEERKHANLDRKEKFGQDKKEWLQAKAEAKTQGQRVKDWIITHPEPKAKDPQYSALPKIPKPQLSQFMEELEEVEGDGGGSDEESGWEDDD